jgi:GAF domain-containing protein
MARVRSAPAVEDVEAVLRLVAAPHAPADTYARIEALAGRLIGHRLFTIMVVDEATGEVERVHSSHPEHYPVGGRKPKRGTPWGAIVLDRGEPFIGRTADDIRRLFDDHPLILGLGLQSIMNVPVAYQGRAVGTMNLLHEAGWFDEADLPAGRLLAGLLLPDVLAHLARPVR